MDFRSISIFRSLPICYSGAVCLFGPSLRTRKALQIPVYEYRTGVRFTSTNLYRYSYFIYYLYTVGYLYHRSVGINQAIT